MDPAVNTVANSIPMPDYVLDAVRTSTLIPALRPLADYTPRIVPFFPGAFVPIEADKILWLR